MRITRGSDYGLRGMLYMARQPMGQVCLVSQVAAAESLPESYLAKIFQDLARHRLLMSHRGAKGGFSLLSNPEEINLLQIIEALQGPVAIAPCLDKREGCERSPLCEISEALDLAQEQMLAVLKSTTLADLAERQDGNAN
ncbi:MAG: Rrf2 family transcriptional regulator [Anaerolineales bacterium]|nr:MAG: Rrf2 family transcriptional regulator [Anaerolineales bacterium]